MLNLHKITARDLPDLWFQAVYNVLKHGRLFTIDKGSYAGQKRLEFDYFIGHVVYPGTKPLLPDIPSQLNIPNPVEEAYLYGGEGYSRSYIEYLMSPLKEPGEAYTYGERLTKAPLKQVIDQLAAYPQVDLIVPHAVDGTVVFFEGNGVYVNQIEWVIETYKNHGHRNNQMVLQIANTTDLMLKDPPCLRSIDTRIQDNRLHFVVYFRSWDLWGGFPANLAAIQILKEYMAGQIGVEDGDLIVESKGLHLYDYAVPFAQMRCVCETKNYR